MSPFEWHLGSWGLVSIAWAGLCPMVEWLLILSQSRVGLPGAGPAWAGGSVAWVACS